MGRALIAAVEGRLKQEKVRFLFVMTLDASDPYEPYRRTRAFYEGLGFELALSAVQPSPNPLAWYLKLLSSGAKR
jgi:hypothetical protein